MSKQRRNVLIIQHPDGYIEAFADKDIDVKVLPIWDPEVWEVATVDEQIETLPLLYRYLHRMDRIRATSMPRKNPKPLPGLWDLLQAFKVNRDQFLRRKKYGQEARQSYRAPEGDRTGSKTTQTRPATPQVPGRACPTT